MSTTLPESQTETPDATPRTWVASWIGLLAGLAVVLGALAGVLWSTGLKLPAYRVLTDGSATISERELTEVVSADIWFILVGALVGLGLGLVTWKWFRALGWPSALLATGAGLVSGLVCWWFGELLGPGHFPDRLAAAQAGDLVPISLELRSWSALAVWGLAAVTPVLLASSFGPDDEDGTHLRRRRPAEAEVEDTASVDERGVLTGADEPVE